MIAFRIHCPHPGVAAEWRDRFCEALAGSPAFVNSEIGVCDGSGGEFFLVVGKSNDHDLILDLMESDLVSWNNNGGERV